MAVLRYNAGTTTQLKIQTITVTPYAARAIRHAMSNSHAKVTFPIDQKKELTIEVDSIRSLS
jgi:hypothetical protein